jgi:predicted CDP-diglyceride synthetase/phosphatidate cytidylyltransferase
MKKFPPTKTSGFEALRMSYLISVPSFPNRLRIHFHGEFRGGHGGFINRKDSLILASEIADMI